MGHSQNEALAKMMQVGGGEFYVLGEYQQAHSRQSSSAVNGNGLSFAARNHCLDDFRSAIGGVKNTAAPQASGRREIN